ncbi:30S ribosomal protein 3 chloroplastic [Euphorbia peplus]|nr:30S ribosomal protein 3 chloroplastic [Euphorbia peplus]
MLSMATQSGFTPILNCSPFPSSKSIKTSFFINPKPYFPTSSTIFSPILRPISRNQRLNPFASPEALTADTPIIVEEEVVVEDEEELIPEEEIKKLEVPVKQIEKPRLVLKFIWMEKNIGLGLDQVIPGHGAVPLSPYYFWPRKDAWEELKTTLESKPWISQKKMIILLNQATDIINLWQQSGGNLTP